MDNFIDSQHGIGVLLSSIAVVLALHLFVQLGKFVFELMKSKSRATDEQLLDLSSALQQNTGAIGQLSTDFRRLERELGEIGKYRMDTQKLFSAVKIVAGDRWPEIRKAMEDDIFPR